MSGFTNPLAPNLTDYTTFIRTQVGIGPVYLPDSSMWINVSFDVAVRMVSLWLERADCVIYTLAVYNYGADRLLNFATDQPGQTYFADARKALNISGFTVGMITSSSDQGTSQSMEVPDWAKEMTIGDLQMARTPYGRQYLAFAQMIGVIWGLT